MSHVMLASRSPRRRALLEEIGFRVDTVSLDVSEVTDTLDPRAAASELAVRKGRAVAEAGLFDAGDFLLAADTIVWTDAGEMLGKPEDRADARRILGLLLGRSHHVTTGYALWRPGEMAPAYVGECSARVTMGTLSEAALEGYLDTSEPWDKAGAYAVQGIAGAFITGIEGSWHTVVGLPVHAVLTAVQSLGLIARMPWERTQ